MIFCQRINAGNDGASRFAGAKETANLAMFELSAPRGAAVCLPQA
jgi:hypothetical protein